MRVRPRIAAGSLAAAVAAGLLVWVIAVPLAGVDLVLAGGRSVGPGSVVLAALLGGAGGWLLLAMLARARRGRERWTVLALAVLLLSLGTPALSGATGGVLVVLDVMHVVVGGALILGLRRGAAPRSVGRRTVGAEDS